MTCIHGEGFTLSVGQKINGKNFRGRAVASRAIDLVGGQQIHVVNRDKAAALIISAHVRPLAPSQPLLHFRLSEVGRDQLVTALLDWRAFPAELPPANAMVLISCVSSETPRFGFYHIGLWYDDVGNQLDPVRQRVYAWAHAPARVAEKGGAS